MVGASRCAVSVGCGAAHASAASTADDAATVTAVRTPMRVAMRDTSAPGASVHSIMSPPTRYEAFVIAAPGLEPLVAAELRALGLDDARPDDGGVAVSASRAQLYAANLHLRTASRVVVRAGEFGAK